ncbi:hypothetical protein Pelo_9211 [Pelomyxa schiedti]|nr:hypothetical protein Pelo_9211 [Pelomyxa schiedti]
MDIQVQVHTSMNITNWTAEHLWAPTTASLDSDVISNLHMEPLSDVTFESIPGCLVITVYNASHSTMNRTRIQIPLYIFLKRLYEPYKTRNIIINLLVFGMSGAGKSEFINSCTTAISQVKVPSIALASGSTSMVTNTFRGYRLIPFESEFTLLDDMKVYIPQNSLIIIHLGQSGYSKRKAPIHCVIFFLPASELDTSPPSTLCKRIQPFMEITKRLGIPAILALSLADRLVSDWANFPRYYVQTAASMFSLPETCVFPLVSYYGASIKNSVTDKIILRVLVFAVILITCEPSLVPVGTKRSSAGHYSNKVDIWSFGAVIHYIFTGKSPFKTYHEVKEGLNIDGLSASDSARVLLRKMLSYHARNRPSVENLCENPWFLLAAYTPIPTATPVATPAATTAPSHQSQDSDRVHLFFWISSVDLNGPPAGCNITARSSWPVPVTLICTQY